jgi:hypothetical protein
MMFSSSLGRRLRIAVALPLIPTISASGKKLPAQVYVEQDIARSEHAFTD